MPAQGALPPVHRAQETQLAARGGERLASLPMSSRTPVPTAAHGSRFLAGAILRRRLGDQDLQRLLRAVPRLRQNDLRHLRKLRVRNGISRCSDVESRMSAKCSKSATTPRRTRHSTDLLILLPIRPPVKRKTVGSKPRRVSPAFSGAQQLAIWYLPIIGTLS